MAGRLSSSPTEIGASYDVVVVGSGYGGSIAASRLARAGKSVCLLERGREFLPGDFPDKPERVLSELQVDTPEARLLNPNGLYHLVLGDSLQVFKGCGLGGTSLVNANVSLRADDRVFEDPCWPRELRAKANAFDGDLLQGFREASAMLRPVGYPENRSEPLKLTRLRESASHVSGSFYRTPINVTFEPQMPNAWGADQPACTDCGDCITGCNVGAKNTTAMNYLPDAYNHGASIFCGVEVRYIERAPRAERADEGSPDRWLVHYTLPGSARCVFDRADSLFIEAEVVVLAGGSLGSTEILLRSAAMGLPLSKTLGHRFSGNGDVLAFAYNGDEDVNAVGVGGQAAVPRAPGPCITGVIDTRAQGRLKDGFVLEDGVLPGAFKDLYASIFRAAARALGRSTTKSPGKLVGQLAREAAGYVVDAYHAAMRRTQTFLVMSHDGADGRLALSAEDKLKIDWAGVGERPIFKDVDDALYRASHAASATFIKNPIWSDLTGNRLVSVHPLGGCPMADDAERGVVNHKGQAFSGAGGKGVYEGLYVADGAIIPRSLGVNPLLTISALAERVCKLLARDRGWTYSTSAARTQKPRIREGSGVGVQFTERMAGYVGMVVDGTFQQGDALGLAGRHRLSVLLTVQSPDVELLVSSPEHPARIAGTLQCELLSPHPLVVHAGTFSLLAKDPERPNARRMTYRMQLRSREGQEFLFVGYKQIENHRGFDLWKDTTTLYTSVYRTTTQDRVPFLRGIIAIAPEDFARQLSTMNAVGGRSPAQRLTALARFAAFFAGTLSTAYGGAYLLAERVNDGWTRLAGRSAAPESRKVA